MRFTEKLANLSIPQVICIAAILLVVRFALTWGKEKEEISPAAKSIAETAESLAVALLLVFIIIKPYIVQAFYIPSPSMHMTLLENDQLIANKFIYFFKEPQRGDIVVFKAPAAATENGVEVDFIKRVIGVPGDKVRITAGYVAAGEMVFNHRDLHYALGATDNFSKVKIKKDGVYIDNVKVDEKRLRDSLNVGKEDKFEFVPGQVYLNGKVLDEPYIAEDCDMPYPMADTPEKWLAEDGKGNTVVKIPEGRLLVMGDNRNNSNDARFWGLLERERIEGKAMVKFWPITRIGLIK